jgi:hypothetical protein
VTSTLHLDCAIVRKLDCAIVRKLDFAIVRKLDFAIVRKLLPKSSIASLLRSLLRSDSDLFHAYS